MISLTVQLELAPDRVDDFLAAMAAHAAASRAEPGCRRFELHRSLERPEVFVLWEAYDDQAALESHHASRHFRRWKELSAEGLLRGRHSIRCEVLDRE